jgi:DNA mismatch repair ATPase MutL
MEYVVSAPSSAFTSPVSQEAPKAKEVPPVENKGFASLTYEEAKKEIAESSPAFTARKKGMELPFEEPTKAKEEVDFKEEINPATGRIKGFIPAEQIGPYVPGPKLGPITRGSLPREDSPEELLKYFPDLHYEPIVLKFNDSGYEKALEEKGEEDSFEANKRYLEELEKKKKQNRIDVSNCVYVGKLFNTYLIYELQDASYIIDQHAAHERLIYNRLREQMDARAIIRQPMLIPYELKLNAFEGEFIREHFKEIEEMGFEIQETSENTFEITAVPVDLQNINLDVFFNDILSDISGYRSIKLVDILKDKLASAACKAAVKGGMDLTKAEIDALFALMDGNMGLKCPHGRPVVVKLSKTEIEKMFKRIV